MMTSTSNLEFTVYLQCCRFNLLARPRSLSLQILRTPYFHTEVICHLPWSSMVIRPCLLIYNPGISRNLKLTLLRPMDGKRIGDEGHLRLHESKRDKLICSHPAHFQELRSWSDIHIRSLRRDNSGNSAADSLTSIWRLGLCFGGWRAVEAMRVN